MAKAMGGLDEILQKAGRNVKTVIGGGKIYHANENILAKAAYGAVNNGLGAAEVGARMMGKAGHKPETFTKAMSNTFKKNGELDYGKIAGAYMGVSAAARVASGGGLYKDRNGNTNIAGVPFL